MEPADQKLIEQALRDCKPPAKRLASQVQKIVPAADLVTVYNGKPACVFRLRGSQVSENIKDQIAEARKNGYSSFLLAADWKEVKPIRESFTKIDANLIFPIQGSAQIIPPHKTKKVASPPRDSITRVPLDLLLQSHRRNDLPEPIKSPLKKLVEDYRAIKARNDTREENALTRFTEAVLKSLDMGSGKILAPLLVKRLEEMGAGGRRDHFFHSFQNFFLGLPIVLEARDLFADGHSNCKIDWVVQPATAWFFTAVWHDTGYCHQHVGKLLEKWDVLDQTDAEEQAQDIRAKMIRSDKTKRYVKRIAHIVNRLACETEAKTGLMLPRDDAKLTKSACSVEEAIFENLKKSHGAASAVKLLSGYLENAESSTDENSVILQQTMYIAAVSMPFHDFIFRDNFATSTGRVLPSAKHMPFAALLAFIDSIQDDRRELDTDTPSPVVLCDLSMSGGQVVTADVARESIPSHSVLEKMIESRHVVSSFTYPLGSIRLDYPGWMTTQTAI